MQRTATLEPVHSVHNPLLPLLVAAGENNTFQLIEEVLVRLFQLLSLIRTHTFFGEINVDFHRMQNLSTV